MWPHFRHVRADSPSWWWSSLPPPPFFKTISCFSIYFQFLLSSRHCCVPQLQMCHHQHLGDERKFVGSWAFLQASIWQICPHTAQTFRKYAFLGWYAQISTILNRGGEVSGDTKLVNPIRTGGEWWERGAYISAECTYTYKRIELDFSQL